MRKEVLSYPERLFLTTSLKGYKAGLEVRWKHLTNAGLGRSQIDNITKKFRKKHWIKKNSYDINEKKIKEIEAVLRHNKDSDKKLHIQWQGLLPFLIMLLILFFFVTLMILLNPKETTNLPPPDFPDEFRPPENKTIIYTLNDSSECVALTGRKILQAMQEGIVLYGDEECKSKL